MKGIRVLIFGGLWLINGIITGQEAPSDIKMREIHAVKASGKIVIDGVLDDAIWSEAPVQSDFTQYEPNPWTPPSHRTEVRIAYDDEALYIGARMFDSAPDSILRQLSSRDNKANTDEFGFGISPYNDGNNGFLFITTPSGVFIDLSISSSGTDVNWDAVWNVKTTLDEKGWIAEFRIPWSALRFSKMENGDKPVWGINFWRVNRRLRELSFWYPNDPTRSGSDMNQNGELHGLRNIDPPPRFTLYPYASTYAVTETDGSIGYKLNGGLDLKAGIGDAFTLDMTLVPDFGQVVADNLVLNLTAYEIEFADNRPFFTEGIDLFNKSGLFYSRRIGEGVQLLNAAKFSGRTSGGLGLGMLQAIAIDSTLDNGLISYSVAVLDQNLPNNSYIHGISTYISREGDEPDALVQGTKFELRNKNNSWAIKGQASYNKLYQFASDGTEKGHSWRIGVSKISGNIVMDVFHYRESENYNPNDLGFLKAPNEVETYLGVGYQIVEPFGRFNKLFSSISAEHVKLFAPREFSKFEVEAELGAMTKGFQFYMLKFKGFPVVSRDYFEPRISGMHWNIPKWWRVSGILSTDYRKRAAVDIRLAHSTVTNNVEWTEFDWRIAPRFRVNDKLSIKYVFSNQSKWGQQGFTTLAENVLLEDVSIFGSRNNISQTHVLTVSYTFTTRAGIDARVRHYWNTVDYLNFMVLSDSGELLPTDIYQVVPDGTSERDINYNAWSVDLGFRWYFTPGSEMSIVWKNTLSSQGDLLPTNYADNWQLMLNESFVNSLSVKVLYYLDYNAFRRK